MSRHCSSEHKSLRSDMVHLYKETKMKKIPRVNQPKSDYKGSLVEEEISLVDEVQWYLGVPVTRPHRK